MPPAWTDLQGGFNHRASGVPGVLLLPRGELDRIRRQAGSYVMASARGMADGEAVRLRLRSAPVTLAVLHTSDFDAMRVGAIDAHVENVLRIRSLRLRERMGLLNPSIWLLVLATIAAAALGLAAAVWPVSQSADAAQRVADALRSEAPALARLENEPDAVLATAQVGRHVQFSLTSSTHNNLPRREVLATDMRLAEDLEHGAARLQAGQGRAEQAASDVRAWAGEIMQQAKHPTSKLRSALDAASKIVAGFAALVAALIALRQALPGTLRTS